MYGAMKTGLGKTWSGIKWTWSGTLWFLSFLLVPFIWIGSKCKQIWQTAPIFRKAWWGGIGSSIVSVLKKPFTQKAPVTADDANASADSALVPNGQASAVPSGEVKTDSRKSRSLKKKKGKAEPEIDSPSSSSASNSEEPVMEDPFASREPDRRRKLYLTLGSI